MREIRMLRSHVDELPNRRDRRRERDNEPASKARHPVDRACEPGDFHALVCAGRALPVSRAAPLPWR